ncbi:type IV pilus modification protein PilV [Hydrogenophaga electricum]|uniref:Type IV pilus modification protein PilV n=1 Tax=Hydrogenophaga electricum TaxID=1230953 RepID=A0ABQ6BZ53_9BURK|nr:type IV pilus modification protein PilV [Hydrogenophaga electricum]GLS12623.1 hypothetical protein GCM10007935_00490 [Hydrogenophaga electricum]
MKPFSNLIAQARRQRGSSMLEILVSLLVISLGLLGVAGLSAATFSYNKTAQVRLTGLGLVNDYADRARANIYGYDLNQYNINLTDTTPDEIDAAPDEASASTAATNVAQDDRRYFMTAASNYLPQGKVVVTSDRTVRSMDIWLLWKEPQTEANDILFSAGQDSCPNISGTDDYNCMYFRVGL